MTILDPELIEQVQDFVSKRCGVKASEIYPFHSLLHDWGIDGDDASYLIGEFSDKFLIDRSTLDFYARCFNSEGPYDSLFLPIAWLAGPFIRMLRPKKIMKVPLTVEDLCVAATNKKWQVPTAAPRFPWQKTR